MYWPTADETHAVLSSLTVSPLEVFGVRPGAGKAKGSTFERLVARDLSLWLTGGVDTTQLIRSVLSGGWSRGQAAGTEAWRHVGDLAPNGPDGERFRKRWAVECKHRQSIDLYGLWTQTKNVDALVGWWRKLQTDSWEHQMEPLLVFRSNRMPIMAGLPRRIATALDVRDQLQFEREALAIVPFEALLQCTPTQFINVAQTE